MKRKPNLTIGVCPYCGVKVSRGIGNHIKWKHTAEEYAKWRFPEKFRQMGEQEKIQEKVTTNQRGDMENETNKMLDLLESLRKRDKGDDPELIELTDMEKLLVRVLDAVVLEREIGGSKRKREAEKENG